MTNNSINETMLVEFTDLTRPSPTSIVRQHSPKSPCKCRQPVFRLCVRKHSQSNTKRYAENARVTSPRLDSDGTHFIRYKRCRRTRLNCALPGRVVSHRTRVSERKNEMYRLRAWHTSVTFAAKSLEYIIM